MDKQKWKRVFFIVKKCIDEMDYLSLLADGAPKDEFDNESLMICSRIRSTRSAEEIAVIIAEVFNDQFGYCDDAVVFLPVAEQIVKEIRDGNLEWNSV